MIRPLLLPALLGWLGMAASATHAAVVTHLVELTETRTSDPAAGELRLWIELEGDLLTDALEYDDLTLTKAIDDTGANLAPEPVATAPARLQKNPAATASPAGKLPVILKLPARAATQLKEITGTVTLLCYRRQVILVERIKDQINQDLKDPLLKAHQLEVRIVDPAQSRPGTVEPDEAAELRDHAVCVRFSGKLDKVLKVELETPDGQTLPTRSSTFGGGRTLLTTLTSDTIIPPDARARITIPISPEEKSVSFSLKEIPLP
jgi:hypothetical protein